MATMPAGVFDTRYSQSLAWFRTRRRRTLYGLLALIILALPVVASSEIMFFLIFMVISAIAAIGLNVLLGYCGQISAAQSAFMAVGAFTGGAIMVRTDWDGIVVLFAAGFGAGLLGLLFGLPSLRVRGLYLALVTIAAQIVIEWGILHGGAVTGGVSGLILPPLRIAGRELVGDSAYYYVAVLAAGGFLFVSAVIGRGRFGRALSAIRDNEPAAKSMGISVFGLKLFAFFFSCFAAGVAGAIWASYVGLASPDHYSLIQSVWLLAMVVVGGEGAVAGPIYGALFVRGTEYMSNSLVSSLQAGGAYNPAFTALPTIVLGLVFAAVLIIEPRGIAHRLQRTQRYFSSWPFPHRLDVGHIRL